MMNKLAFIGLIVLLAGCKKEPTVWTSDWTSPVAHGHLTLADAIPAEYLSENTGGYYSIVYHEPVYTFTIDTLVKLPDTTILKKSAIGVSSLNVNPGFSFTDTYDQEYSLDQIELKKVQIASGTIEVQISCPWPGASLVTFTFPKITYAGIPFERTYAMPAASIANPATASEVIDLAGYLIDLTGTSGNLINMLSAEFIMGSNESTNTYIVSDTDSIEYKISFKSLKPDYAKGYFGQYLLSDTVGLSLDFMKNITGGSVDLDSIDLTLTVKNGFNLIAQAKITYLQGINSVNNTLTDLTFPMLNTSMNIDPASGGIYDFTPSQYPITINSSNSNIIPFLENLNDSLRLGYEININPYGNVTAGSDEIFPGSKLELFLDAEFPLEFGANNLMVCDTFEIDYDNPEGVLPEEAQFVLQYVNAFPAGADASFILQDVDGNTIDTFTSAFALTPGTYNTSTNLTTASSGELQFDLNTSNIANLDAASFVVLKITFNSDDNQLVKINSSAYLDFILKTNLQLTVSL